MSHVEISPLVWGLTLGITAVLLAFDVFVLGRKPHVPTMKEVTGWLAFYVGLAVAFGVGLWFVGGHQAGAEFFAGWLTEYSLSIDNLFIFIIIMAKFQVPKKYQQEALLVGIIIALVMRGIFIAVGAAAINQFSWIFYIFGAFLVYTAAKLAKEAASDDGEEDFEENRLMKWVEDKFPTTEQWHGVKPFVKENGKRLATPMFIVIMALGTTDLLFALDSIPAIYGLTQEPYIVLTANIFALMGLRQLYFLIGGLLQRLVYLSYGLSFLLLFIGIKLILHAMHENELPFLNGGEHISWAPDIPIWLSLVVIIGTLVLTAVLSLTVGKNKAQDSTLADSVPKPGENPDDESADTARSDDSRGRSEGGASAAGSSG